MRARSSLLLLLGVVGLAGCRARSAVDAGPSDAGEPAAPATGSSRMSYPAGRGSFVDLVAEAAPAVVSIQSTTPVKAGPGAIFPGSDEASNDVALGTGFLIEKRGTFVLTNDHVIEGAPELRVVLHNGTKVNARVVGRDPRMDLALLLVDAPRLPALQLGSSKDLRVGEWIVVLGDPFGDEVTASAGVVSSTGTHGLGSAIAGPSSLFRTYLQTDARIHRGNSGGPVLDASGKVVGVAVATGERPGEVSFAIPIDQVKNVLESLRDYGAVARAYLGARVNTPQPGLALPGEGGAQITEVDRDTPAARAGLRVGDVIMKWDGRPVDERTLPTLVSSAVVGKAITVSVFRSGGLVDVTVTPEKLPG